MGHLNNTLMLVSIFLFGVGGTKGMLYPRMRHPMLWGTVIWSVSHLLVNGDVASLVAGLLISSALTVERRDRSGRRPARGMPGEPG